MNHAEGLTTEERKPNGKRGTRRRKGGTYVRDPATVEREHRALTMLVKGHSQRAIALELDMSEGGVSGLIRRALEARARALGPVVESARVLLWERYERLLERWWPMATGDWVDPEAPEPGETPPSRQAVDVVLKIMENMAKISGADRGPVQGAGAGQTPESSAGGIHVHIHTPAERQQLQEAALLQLATVRQKQVYVDGELARVGTSQAELTGGPSNDKPGPPPTRDKG